MAAPRPKPVDVVRQLREILAKWEGTLRAPSAVAFSSGCGALDRLLPGGRLRLGMVIEWLADAPASGAGSLALRCARQACRQGGVLVVVDRCSMFYPPAAVAQGVDPRRLLVVEPQNHRDELWALTQALRSPAVAAVWTPVETIDSRAFRRLQLAAQAGQTLGLLLRPPTARGQPSWADVQLGVAAWGAEHDGRQGIAVRVLRSRGGRTGGVAHLSLDHQTGNLLEVKRDHETHPGTMAAGLVDPASPGRSA